MNWEEIKEKRESSDTKRWCLVGDFNCVRRSSERMGVGESGYGRSEREEFNAFIKDIELEDVSLIRRKFTRYRSNGRANCRIDRVLVSKKWLDVWQGCSHYILPRSVSDHFPILLKNSNIRDPNLLGSLIVG